MSFPFRCKKCSTILYHQKYGVTPSHCGEKATPLANICLLIPTDGTETENTLIHTTKPLPELGEPGGQTWKFACGRSSYPNHYTDSLTACTCEKCKDFAETYVSRFGWSLEDLSPENQTEEPVN